MNGNKFFILRRGNKKNKNDNTINITTTNTTTNCIHNKNHNKNDKNDKNDIKHKKHNDHTTDKRNEYKNNILTIYNRMDILSNGFNRINNKIIDLCDQDDEIKRILNNLSTTHISNVNSIIDTLTISIPNMNFDKKVNCIILNNVRLCEEMYEICNMKIVKINGCIELENQPKCNISGTITIFNLDNGTEYNGLIYKNHIDDKIQYILSNRPIVPLNVIMHCLVYIKFKIIL